MFNKKTLFVLGAGASREVNLPTGAELAAQIAKVMDVWWDDDTGNLSGTGDREFFGRMVRASGLPQNAVARAAKLIRSGISLGSSVDDFLDQHQADEAVLRMGKSGIARQILEAEKKSPMFVPLQDGRGLNRPYLDITKIDESWFVRFGRMAGKNVTVANVDHIFEEVAFVTFNYEAGRCSDWQATPGFSHFINLY